jgi:hypothetical protein
MFQHFQYKHNTCQRGIKYSDITAGKKIGTAVRGSLNKSQNLMTITDYFSKYKYMLWSLCMSSVIHASSPISH